MDEHEMDLAMYENYVNFSRKLDLEAALQAVPKDDPMQIGVEGESSSSHSVPKLAPKSMHSAGQTVDSQGPESLLYRTLETQHKVSNPIQIPSRPSEPCSRLMAQATEGEISLKQQNMRLLKSLEQDAGESWTARPTAAGGISDNLPTFALEHPAMMLKTFSAPKQLLISSPRATVERGSIIQASIERIQDDLIEKDRLRAEEARNEECFEQERRPGEEEWHTDIEQSNKIDDEPAEDDPKSKGKGKATEPIADLNHMPPPATSNTRFSQNPSSPEAYLGSGMDVNWNMPLWLCTKPNEKRHSNMSANTTSSFTGDSGYSSMSLAESNSIKARIGRVLRFGTSFNRGKSSTEPTSGPATTPITSKSKIITECVSCLEGFKPKQVVTLECHSYCKPCFNSLITNAVTTETQWPPKCCSNQIPIRVILSHVNTKTAARYKAIHIERAIPSNERVYCSRASCARFIHPKNINPSNSCASCPKCRQKSCTFCRGKYHGTGVCPEDPGLQATIKLAADAGWRRCYSCSAIVEHNDGCFHMTCKCKAEFCYVCGARWRNCACTYDMHLIVLEQAIRTRVGAIEGAVAEQLEDGGIAEAQQRASEEEEDAELSEILREIEDFEEREALRLVAESEERASIEKMQMQRKRLLLQEINKRFFELRSEMEVVAAAPLEMKERETLDMGHGRELQDSRAAQKHKQEAFNAAWIQDYDAGLEREWAQEKDFVVGRKQTYAGDGGIVQPIATGREGLWRLHREEEALLNGKSEIVDGVDFGAEFRRKSV